MLILKNNPFYLKFFTSIEGYIHLFLSPILIYYIAGDIKLSGLFFLIENLCRFSAYSLSGSIITPDNINSIIKVSYISRFFFVLMALIIFHWIPENTFALILINGLGFIVTNSFYVTSIETLFQNHELFDKNIQSKLTAGDLWSGGISVLVILLFTIFKISFIYLIPIEIFCFIGGLTVLHRLVESLRKLKLFQLRKLLKNSVKDFGRTVLFIKSSDDLITNMIIGYLPFAFFLVIEQVNIFRFSHQYQDLTMKIIHYSFKSFWFFTGALLVPLIVKKSSNITQVFKIGVYSFIIGGSLSLVPQIPSLNILGAIFLGYAHNLIFVYRKVNRRKILEESNVGFQSLGVFFAIEGLSGAFANTFLSIFGQNMFIISLAFLLSVGYFIRILSNLRPLEVLPLDPQSETIESEQQIKK